MDHVKTLGLAAVIVAGTSLAAPANAAPMPLSPLGAVGSEAAVETVDYICGPGRRITPSGRCRPNFYGGYFGPRFRFGYRDRRFRGDDGFRGGRGRGGRDFDDGGRRGGGDFDGGGRRGGRDFGDGGGRGDGGGGRGGSGDFGGGGRGGDGGGRGGMRM